MGRQATIAQNPTTTTLTYNLAGEPVQESYSGGPLNGLSVTNGYDQWLRRTNVVVRSASASLHSAGYSYDEASRLRSVASGQASATYSYLANSPLVSQIAFTNNGVQRMVTSKKYDLLNRLENIKSVPAASAAVSFDYTYNPANQRTLRRETDASYWRYEYDALGQVTSGKKYWSDGTPVAGQQFDYTFDDIGNRQTAGAGGDQYGANLKYQRYTVNSLNQYTSRSVPGFVNVVGTANSQATVTINGTPTYRKGEYFRGEVAVDNTSGPVWRAITNLAVLNNGSNPDIVTNVVGNTLVAARQEVFTHDSDGNLTADSRWSYTWNAENRLIAMESAANVPAAAKRKLEFTYDGQGRRIQKLVSTNNGTIYLPALTNRFVYDGWNLVAVLGADNSLRQSFAWGTDLSGTFQGAGGVGGLLWIYDSSTINNQPSTHFVAHDGNGNVTTLVNATDGSESGRYEYGPFGEVIRITGAMAKANPFRFSTKSQDDETDLVYYGYRYEQDARWLSRDPLGERGGHNLYGLVREDTINLIDALGLDGGGATPPCPPGNPGCTAMPPPPPPGTPPGGVGPAPTGLLLVLNTCTRWLDKKIIEQAIDRAMKDCKAQMATRPSGKKCCAVTWCYQCGCNTGSLNKLDRIGLGLVEMSCVDLKAQGTIGPACSDKNDKRLDTYDDMQKP